VAALVGAAPLNEADQCEPHAQGHAQVHIGGARLPDNRRECAHQGRCQGRRVAIFPASVAPCRPGDGSDEQKVRGKVEGFGHGLRAEAKPDGVEHLQVEGRVRVVVVNDAVYLARFEVELRSGEVVCQAVVLIRSRRMDSACGREQDADAHQDPEDRPPATPTQGARLGFGD